MPAPPVAWSYAEARRAKGLTRADVAAQAWPPTTGQNLSRIESGDRAPSPAMRDALDPVIALGVRGEDEERPCYVLALRAGEHRGFMGTEDARWLAFASRADADSAAHLFRAVTRLDIAPMPAWRTFIAGRGGHVAWLDGSEGGAVVAALAAAYAEAITPRTVPPEVPA